MARSLSPATSKWGLAGVLVMVSLSVALSAQLSPEKSVIFGPGVHPDKAGLPVNYFYIQAVDSNGEK